MTDLAQYAYPAIGERLKVDDLPARKWVECASCIEIHRLDDRPDEAEAWARAHRSLHPSHDRFRIVRQTTWRIVPTSEEPEGGYPLEPFPALQSPRTGA